MGRARPNQTEFDEPDSGWERSPQLGDRVNLIVRAQLAAVVPERWYHLEPFCMSNHHPDLAVVASTRASAKLAGASQQPLPRAGPDGGEAGYEAGQDIETFGIAGR